MLVLTQALLAPGAVPLVCKLTQALPPLPPLILQVSSVSETLSTLNFGKGVTEITLGAAKCNADSGALYAARERAVKAEKEVAALRAELAAAKQQQERAQRAMPATPSSLPGKEHEQEAHIAAYRPGLLAQQADDGGFAPHVPAAVTPGSARPPQVPRLNLNSKLITPQREGPGSQSARGAPLPTKIPTPASAWPCGIPSQSGSFTARLATSSRQSGLFADERGSQTARQAGHDGKCASVLSWGGGEAGWQRAGGASSGPVSVRGSRLSQLPAVSSSGRRWV